MVTWARVTVLRANGGREQRGVLPKAMTQTDREAVKKRLTRKRQARISAQARARMSARTQARQ